MLAFVLFIGFNSAKDSELGLRCPMETFTLI